jgi:hypothetical protein
VDVYCFIVNGEEEEWRRSGSGSELDRLSGTGRESVNSSQASSRTSLFDTGQPLRRFPADSCPPVTGSAAPATAPPPPDSAPAWHHSPVHRNTAGRDGAATVEGGERGSASTAPMLRIEVHDRGPGISKVCDSAEAHCK